MKLYNDKVLRAYEDLQLAGAFLPDDGVMQICVGSLQQGEVMQLQIKFEQDKIIDARHKTFGCGYGIACNAFIANWVIGKTLSELQTFQHERLIDAFDLPKEKYHSAFLGEHLVEQVVVEWERETCQKSQLL